jgi:hypothetical protein
MVKNKILFILTLCVLGLFWDDLSMRVAQLELDGKDSGSRRSRLTAVEKKAEKIALLENQLKNVEERLRLLNPLLAKSNLNAQRVALLEQLLEKTALADRGVKVFRTAAHADRVEVASIGSHPTHQHTNWGGCNFFRAGSVGPGNVGRTLLKFNELNADFFQGKKILAAVLYMKQTVNDSTLEDDDALNETIDLYAVRKKWGEGYHVRGKAFKGEVTWVSARTDEEDWTVPGCSSISDDFDPLLLGTTGPAVSGDATEWVTIVLNADGISRLLDKSWPNNGFLLKMRDETKPNTAVFFNSDKGFKDNIPYMEVYYQDEKAKQERH